MGRVLEPDICVIGAGAAGLSVAAGASQMGAATVLIERGARMGGECLNVGCVPSKALLAAAHAAESSRQGGRFGVNGHAPKIDFAAVHRHVRGVIEAIAPMDSEERFEGLGVTVLREHARFTGPRELTAGNTRVRARRFVIATGSRPAVPPVPGLDATPYETNETIFEREVAPAHLLIIGGGPIGVELAQAHRRLGAAVTLIDLGPILPKDDPELVQVVRRRLLAEGVTLKERVKVRGVERAGNGIAVTVEGEDGNQRIEGSDLLVAAGRKPVVDGLDLETAGVAFDQSGIRTDARLRTSNRRIFAIGDVAGSYQFTHVCSYHAGIVIKNALFRLPARVDYRALPWVTYTEPELAQVGQGEVEARAADSSARVLRWSFAENDRAQAERAAEGLIKVVTNRRGRVLGASIVGRQAGELILPWVLAVAQRLKIGAMANLIVPYPTLGEVSKRAAGAYYTPTLFGARTRWLVRQLARLG